MTRLVPWSEMALMIRMRVAIMGMGTPTGRGLHIYVAFHIYGAARWHIIRTTVDYPTDQTDTQPNSRTGRYRAEFCPESSLELVPRFRG